MNSLLKNTYNTRYVEDSEENFINPFPVSIPYDTGMLLNEMIRKYNLERTLEVGMAYGLSTLFICQAHHDKGVGSHTAIDPHQTSNFKSIGLLNIKRAGLGERLRFFEACSYEVLPQLLAKKEQFDFAFIDGAHQFDYVLVDFFYVDKLLQTGGYIAFDDLWFPSIRKVLYFVLKNRAYELVKIDTKASFLRRMGRITRRFLQNPLERDFNGIKLIPANICLLRKISGDNRYSQFHHSF